jgi:hypothetical protein
LFGWMYLAIFILFVTTRAKTYYIAPIYPVMLAGGAVFIERLILHWKRNWLKPVIITFLAAGGIVTAPLVLPVLPVEAYIEYSARLGIVPQPSERHEIGPLPQHYADMFGWENMAKKVAKVYHHLSPEEKSKCGIFVQNYGEAGAIDFFGQKLGLPKAISGHNNYWLWGARGYTGEIMIIIGGNRNDYEEIFQDVEQVEVISHKYAMPYENNLPVYLCRKGIIPLKKIWPKIKHYE